jgi:hypothetical protein
LDYFFKFLEIDDDINYVLAGYFHKVANTFFEGDYLAMILEYFYAEERHTDNLIKHIYCKSLAMTLNNFLNFETPSPAADSQNSSQLNGFGDTDFDLGATIGDSNKFSNALNGEDNEGGEDIEENIDGEGEKKKSEAQVKLDELLKTVKEKRIKIFKNLINNLVASTDLEVISNTKYIFSEFFSNSKDVDSFKEIMIELFMKKETLDTIFKCLQLRSESSGFKAKVSSVLTKVSIITSMFCQALDIISKKGEDCIDFSENMGKF